MWAISLALRCTRAAMTGTWSGASPGCPNSAPAMAIVDSGARRSCPSTARKRSRDCSPRAEKVTTDSASAWSIASLKRTISWIVVSDIRVTPGSHRRKTVARRARNSAASCTRENSLVWRKVP